MLCVRRIINHQNTPAVLASPLSQAALCTPLRASVLTRRRFSSTSATAASASARRGSGVVRVAVLGGYGEFGSRISKRLHIEQLRPATASLAATTPPKSVQVIIAGRDLSKARAFADKLNRLKPLPRPSDDAAGVLSVAAGATPPNAAEAIRVDLNALTARAFADWLTAHAIDIVVHTCGPFVRSAATATTTAVTPASPSPSPSSAAASASGYLVADGCIEAGVHYVDLADDREFVCQFSGSPDTLQPLANAMRQTNDRDTETAIATAAASSTAAATASSSLHARAVARGVCLISGASSVPGLSSAVCDWYIPGSFSSVHSIRSAISPGNRTPRGIATVQSVFAYAGRAYTVWRDSGWARVYGWGDLATARFHPQLHPTHVRVVANCNVPDLSLFVKRYRDFGVRAVSFQAGLELSWFTISVALVGWCTRTIEALTEFRVPVAWTNRLAYPLKRVSEWGWVWALGTDAGGMTVTIDGCAGATPMPAAAVGGKPNFRKRWELYAGSGDGPEIPSTPAVILVQKLIDTPPLPAPASQPKATAPPPASNAPAAIPLHTGAYPCVGVFHLGEFLTSLKRYDIKARVVSHPLPNPRVEH